MPQNAIATMQLVPGSNPVFGLNTLGGALAIYTKDGVRYRRRGRRSLRADRSAARWSGARRRRHAGRVRDCFVAGEALHRRRLARALRHPHRTSLRRASTGATGATTRASRRPLADNTLERHAGAAAVDARPSRSSRTPGPTPPRTGSRFVSAQRHARAGRRRAADRQRLLPRAPQRRRQQQRQRRLRPGHLAAEAFNVQSRATTRGLGRVAAGRRGGATSAGTRTGWSLGARRRCRHARTSCRPQQTATFSADREPCGIGPYSPEHRRRDSTTRTLGVYAPTRSALDAALDADAVRTLQRAHASGSPTARGTRPPSTAPARYRRFNPALGRDVAADARRSTVVREREPGDARADARRADLRRSRTRRARCRTSSSPIRRCSRWSRRPSRLGGAAASTRRGFVERRRLPHRPARRHPVHQRGQRRGQRRLFPQRRATRAGKASSSAAASPLGACRVVARYSLLDATFRSDVHREQPEQLDRRRERRHRRAAGRPHARAAAHTFSSCAPTGRRRRLARRRSRCSPSARSTRAATRTTGRATGRCPDTPS